MLKIFDSDCKIVKSPYFLSILWDISTQGENFFRNIFLPVSKGEKTSQHISKPPWRPEEIV